ncbi:SDR family NAD(P)-dependent oxidoreductase [Candidatus Epulonipiscium viviparus]|uniref:SDR family NAD(P)-dependent oxidoreductase n=1 Tax=Candidatus Epulonipiscium viviparus TaxID=420336 RepID=UPI002738138E|nr:glucose 1-dehydrogenase [Candidatus Epulopiscium viviparus]
MLLEGKTALITGSNRGIGAAILEAYASNGAAVVAHARQETAEFTEHLGKLADTYKVAIEPIYFDLSDADAVKNAMREFMKKKMPIDALVNNAGIVHNSLFHRSTMAELEQIFQVNLFAPFILMQNISRLMMKNGGGSIINIASIAGKDVRFGRSIYCSSKAAMISMTEALSKELAGNNIRVNCIAPGVIQTDMIKLQDDQFVEEQVNQTDMRRMGTPADVANAAVFLASEKSNFISGQVIVVDGGLIRN